MVLPSKVGNVISMGFKLVSIASLYGIFMIKILGMPIIINHPQLGFIGFITTWLAKPHC